ncbi:DUF7344 domain-containing protein [Natrononativus amylolyticus]|uniref:DUF7344 domain-containing protein n=1 Tax=Natrononativus amylolyticus TaxID=2963434 RepID=UPI0020CDAE2A|nr:hypothetical protein [Natrononativus amylolyticus]
MVEVDTVLGLLNERRRRYALYYLAEQDGPVPVQEVVDAVAEMEANAEQFDVPDDRFGRVETALQHTHLPMIDEVEFIEYDADERVVRLTDSPPTFDAILTVAKVLER